MTRRKDGRQPGAADVRAEREALKALEPIVVHESKWVDRAQLLPSLRRVLDMPCWPDAEVQLMAGMPVHDVARYIQEDRREGGWMSRATLRNYLSEIRLKAPLTARLAQWGPQAIEGITKRWGGRAAELSLIWREIEELAVKLERAHAREELSGADDPETLKMTDTLLRLCSKAFEMKRELGLIAEATPEGTGGVSVELEQRVRMKYGERVAAVLHDPAAVGRVTEAFKLLTQAAGLPGSGLDLDEDYEYAERAAQAREGGDDGGDRD